MLIGYARCSTAHQDQDLTAQHDGLTALGVAADRIYTDVGLSGTNCERPGLRKALAALREGDTLVVTKLDRLARSVKDAADIAADIEQRGARLSLGGSVYDSPDPMGKLLSNVLAMVAEFEADLIPLQSYDGSRRRELGLDGHVCRTTGEPSGSTRTVRPPLGPDRVCK